MSDTAVKKNEKVIKILVVDDDEMTRHFLSHVLAQQGYEVQTAVGGREAVEKLKEHAYALVLLDIEMPWFDGLEVLRHIREHHSKATLPIIMVTASDKSSEIILALDMGANDYVTKPLDVPVLFARMRAHLATSRGE